MEHDVGDPLPEHDEPQARHRVARGGWRRILAGFLVGAVVGAAIGLVLPRDDGPVRPRPGG
ncbi:MAG: hypothetical protein ACLFUG_04045 [Nitriliruptoraceae bacterium]